MAVREGLLALLRSGARPGYQLKRQFEATTGGVWPLNVGQVYTTLERLERDGLVSVQDEDGQKVYELTRAGVEELGAWWEATPTDDPPPRDELMLKVLMAVGDGPARALAVVTQQRTALHTLLRSRRRSRRPDTGPGHGAGEALASALVGDALLVRAEADLRWLDLCEARITAAGAARKDVP
ncbi:MAG TPA: helix-turn-helix transcriptional regulator [Acidimicrobiales bacterium]|nr:helix-turn-helix transcriptional regulator [Acidimicrobiales bacterium]